MENRQPLISILIPTYNRPEYLKECLDSVLSQVGFKNIELEFIVSDNSENDDTKILLDWYVKNNQNKIIKYNKNKVNLWMVWNWNKLLELKSWEYFIFLSDDDKFYDENSLKILYDNLLEYNLDVIFWISRNINDEWNFISIDEIKKIKLCDETPINIKTITKRILIFQWWMGFWWILYKNYKIIFDLKAWPWADAEFNMSYSNLYKIWLINKTTFLYRIHQNNESKKVDFTKYNDYILQKHWMNKYFIKYIYLQSSLREKIIRLWIKISLKLWIYWKMYDLYRKIF